MFWSKMGYILQVSFFAIFTHTNINQNNNNHINKENIKIRNKKR